MSKIEMHYLNCTNENCEVFCCVARRDYEHKIKNARSELIKEMRECGERGTRGTAIQVAANYLESTK